MLQRVSLQYWQKLQSGQGFFFRISFIASLIYLVYPFVKTKVKQRASGKPVDKSQNVLRKSWTTRAFIDPV